MATPQRHDLTGQVILVTGSAKRIGRAIALRLAEDGARVAIHCHGSIEEARQTAEECGGAPVFQADLTSVAEIERLVGEVGGHFGRLDGLVNNAARFTRFDPLEKSDWLLGLVAHALVGMSIEAVDVEPRVLKRDAGAVVDVTL